MAVDVREVDARAADLVDPGIGGHRLRVRATALACAEACGARGPGRLEEGDAIAPRPAARTRRPAVHAGRADGVDEQAVGGAVVADDGVPAGGIVQMRCCRVGDAFGLNCLTWHGVHAREYHARRGRRDIRALRMNCSALGRARLSASPYTNLRRSSLTRPPRSRNTRSMLQDLRYAARTLLTTPAFTLVVVVTLALGIGANTAIFSLTDQVLLRLLPVKAPERLVVLDGPGAFQGRTFNNGTFSYPMYRDFRDRSTVFDGVLARFPAPLTVMADGQAERVSGELVSGNYFDVLGVRAYIGRTFTPDDDRTPGGHPVAMLSHHYWTRRFGADPGVLNRTVTLNGLPMTIVGVTPPGFYGIVIGENPDGTVPVAMNAQMTPTWDDLQNRRSRWLTIMA